MKSINIIYKTKDDLLKNYKEIMSYPPENILIQIFTSIINDKVISELQYNLRELFPGIAVIGATTSSDIINAEIIENSIVVSISLFNHTKVHSLMIDQNDNRKEAAESVIKKFGKINPKALLIFGTGLKDGKYRDDIDFLNVLNEEFKDTIIAGGLAGTNRKSLKTFIFNKETIIENGYVAVALSGDRLRVGNAYNLSWIPIGKKMYVTKAKGKRVYEIDNKSVNDIYKQYLGIEYKDENIEHPVLDFPLMITRGNEKITNIPKQIYEDGSIEFLRNFNNGEQVNFSYCNFKNLKDGMLQLIQITNEYQPESVFVYSCEARKTVLGKEITFDMISLKNSVDSAGFFTYGEYYTNPLKEFKFFQQTMSILMLSEKDINPMEKFEVINNIIPSDFYSKQFLIQKVLGQLVKSTTRELEEKNAKLTELARKDALTDLYNRGCFDRIMLEEIKNHARSKQAFSLILMDIDYFKEFNDEYGHVVGDDCLRAIAQLLKKETRRFSDKAFRYGGEEFACVLPYTDLNGAQYVVEKIRKSIEDLMILHKKSKISEFVTASFGVITVNCIAEPSVTEVVEACDNLLYKAKGNGRNCYVAATYTENRNQ